MKNKKSSTEEKRYKKFSEDLDKKFQELKRRTEIKERYGVFTQKMLEDLFEKTLTLKLTSFLGKLSDIFASKDDLANLSTKSDIHKLDGKLDWLITKYKKFDQEQTLLSKNVSEHSDRLEVVEKRIGIAV